LANAAELAVELYFSILKRSDDRQRVVFSYELAARADELSRLADAVDKRAGDAPATLLREATGNIREIPVHIRQMADAVRQPFMLFVVGMGKFGKSTLINALLGVRAADMDVLPKTWKIDVFSAKRPPNRVLVKMRTGAEREMTVDEAGKLLAKEESAWAGSKRKIDAELRKKMPSLSTIEQREEYKAFLRKRFLYQSPVSEVHSPSPQSRLLQRFNIVDTPGLFQELITDDVEMRVRDYYHKADGVLWLLDATKISSQKPRDLLTDLDKALEEVGGRTDNIVAVLNRIDLVGDDSVRKKVLDEAYRIFGDTFRAIVPFSAKGALLAVERNDREQMEEHGLNGLIRSIEKHFLSRAVKLQKESKIVGLRGYVSDAAKIAEVYIERLEGDDKKRKDSIRDLEVAVESLKQQSLRRVATVLNSYREQTVERINTFAENIYRIDDEEERNRYAREAIFNEKELDELFESLESSIQRNAADVYENHRAKAIFREFEHLGGIALPQEVTPVGQFEDIDLDHAHTSIAVAQAFTGIGVAMVGALLLGPIGLLAGLLSITKFGREVMIAFQLPGLKTQLTERLDKCMADSKTKYEQSVRVISREILSSVSIIRETSFSSLHCPSKSIQEIIKELKGIPSIGNRPLDDSSVSLGEILAFKERI
jgi:GTPase SAR1 family protein